MKRELGIARCGLACCLCGESEHCAGCDSGDCPDKDGCVEPGVLLGKGNRPLLRLFRDGLQKGNAPKEQALWVHSLFARRYGEQALLDCLERNEEQGVVYHREGVVGDYDGFADVEALAHFIRTGQR